MNRLLARSPAALLLPCLPLAAPAPATAGRRAGGRPRPAATAARLPLLRPRATSPASPATATRCALHNLTGERVLVGAVGRWRQRDQRPDRRLLAGRLRARALAAASRSAAGARATRDVAEFVVHRPARQLRRAHRPAAERRRDRRRRVPRARPRAGRLRAAALAADRRTRRPTTARTTSATPRASPAAEPAGNAPPTRRRTAARCREQRRRRRRRRRSRSAPATASADYDPVAQTEFERASCAPAAGQRALLRHATQALVARGRAAHPRSLAHAPEPFPTGFVPDPR